MINSTMMDDYPLTIGAILRHGERVYGQSECVTWTGEGEPRRATYAQVAQNARKLAGALAGLGAGPPVVDVPARSVVLPVDAGPAILPELAARLAASGLRIADLALRRPTLDDVFLTLTGHAGPGADREDHRGRDPLAQADHPQHQPRSAP